MLRIRLTASVRYTQTQAIRKCRMEFIISREFITFPRKLLLEYLYISIVSPLIYPHLVLTHCVT